MSSFTIQPSRKQHCLLSAYPQRTIFQCPYCIYSQKQAPRGLPKRVSQLVFTYRLHIQGLVDLFEGFGPLFCLGRELNLDYSLPQAPQCMSLRHLASSKAVSS